MLSQAFYWNGKIPESRKGWFYKTQKEWTEETCLSRREQETARKTLLATGIWEEKLEGIPAKLHFRINLAALYAKLVVLSKKQALSMAESAILDCTEAPYLIGGFRQTTICTETTSESTAESTKSVFGKTEKGISFHDSPKPSTKAEKLESILPSPKHPSEAEFQAFLDTQDLKYVTEYKPELYDSLCRNKWHDWKNGRWHPIRDWRKYVEALNLKIEKDKNRQ